MANRYFISSLSIVFLLLLSIFPAGCFSIDETSGHRLPDYGYEPPKSGARKDFRRLPWEIWPVNKDLDGKPLYRGEILRGDELFSEGAKKQALEQYLKARKAARGVQETESLALRIASTQLSLRQPAQALSTISEHFKSQKLSVDRVDLYFSVVLAFAYGETKDYDQSFAWFSRIHRMSAGRGSFDAAASQGVRAFVQAMPDDSLLQYAESWGADSFVASIIGEERKRRDIGGVPVSEQTLGSESTVPSGESQSVTSSGAKSKIGVILPLSGKFAGLGSSVRNGIELAYEGSEIRDSIDLVFIDDGGDSASAPVKARELLEQQQVSVILGPLITELAESVSNVAKSNGTPIVTYSKKDAFPTGGGVFRLGPTSGSQVNSLLSAVSKKLGIRRVGMIWPQDPTGSEFASAFRDGARSHGIEIVFESSYPKGSLEVLSSLGPEVEKHPVDAIFLPDGVLEASRFFSSLPPSFRSKITPIGVALWDNTNQLNRSRAIIDGAVLVSPFYLDSPRPVVSTFVQTYEQRFNQKPDFLAAQGFDSATLVLAAIKRQREGGGALESSLYSIDHYDGLTGTISISDSGEFLREFAVLKFTEGRLVELGNQETPNFIMKGNQEVKLPPPQVP